MSNWAAEEFRALPLEQIDVRYGRYRLQVLEAEEAMVRSLRRYGQMSPLVVCLREEVPVLVDGFKRLAAARGLKGFGSLSARWPADAWHWPGPGDLAEDRGASDRPAPRAAGDRHNRLARVARRARELGRCL